MPPHQVGNTLSGVPLYKVENGLLAKNTKEEYTMMYYIGLGFIFLIVSFRTIRGYFQMEAYLKYKEPQYTIHEVVKLNTVYQGSVNGVINTHDYQQH